MSQKKQTQNDSKDTIERLKRRILFGIKQPKITEEAIINIHHILMMNYGWIPFEEFKNLPIPTVLNLLDKIAETNKEINRRLKKR